MDITRIRIADWAVLKGQGVLKTIGLGSCLGVALYDPQNKAGGLVHVLLHNSREFQYKPNPFNPAKFVDTALPLLVRELEGVGGKKHLLQAKMAGGSQLFFNQKAGESIGEKNIQMARLVLKELGIPIVGEDVGGNYGRTLHFFIASGKMVISTVGRGEKEI